MRSETSLVQTIGRAARNVNGKVIMYADTVTPSMERAISETERRRAIQSKYNEDHGITPKSIVKEIRDVIEITKLPDEENARRLSPIERQDLIRRMTKEMRNAAELLEFEYAAELRIKIDKLNKAEIEGVMSKDSIIIKGAREHNLKNIDVVLPRDKLIVMTGLSGSGKSSLAFDTIFADGQRRYMESLSSYARQFLGQMDKPDVDYIEGLSPAISIDQKTTSKNPRSTLVPLQKYDYLRLMWARIGIPHCPYAAESSSSSRLMKLDSVIKLPVGARFQLLAPVVRSARANILKSLKAQRKAGLPALV